MSSALSQYVLLFLMFAHTLYMSKSQDMDTVTIQSIQLNSESGTTRVTLQCYTGVVGNVTFWRRIGDNVMELGPDAEGKRTIQSSRLFRFYLTRDLEGLYFCKIGNITSINYVELIAYPSPDTDILLVKQYNVSLGNDITVDCAYLPGALQKSSVKWYKGLTELTIAPTSPNVRVASNFSLVVSNTTVGDASYYRCEVRFTLQDNSTVIKQSPMVKIEVQEPIRVTQPISDVAVRPNERANFTCKASGVPQPNIKWLLNGREVHESITTNAQKLPRTVLVTSILKFDHLLVRQAGPVTCVAYHMMNSSVIMSTSGANLVVLTSDFSVRLTPTTNGTAHIFATLPARIPGSFSLVVQFSFNPENRAVKEILSPSLKDTDTIDIIIPREKLPSFKTFRIMVAIKSNGVQGDFSGESEPIILSNELPVITLEQCDCTNTDGLQPSGSSSAITALLAVFIVLMLLFLAAAGVMIALCVHYFYRRKPIVETVSNDGRYSQKSKSFDQYLDDSLARSISRSSCNSRGSGRSSRSSHSSRSSASYRSTGSMKDKAGYASPEYDTADHVQLKQWGSTGKGIAGGEGKPKPLHERLNPAHVSNPAFIRYEKNKTEKGGSSSSFEDLEMESQEFTNSTDIHYHTDIPIRTA